MIYLILRGRIGNQLFMYAAARKIQYERGNVDTIIIDDKAVTEVGWINSLLDYKLPNVSYVHEHEFLYDHRWKSQLHCMTFYQNFIFKKSYEKKFQAEKRYAKLFNLFGYIACENGYLPYKIDSKKNVLMDGYFQSEKYFANIDMIIRNEFDLKSEIVKYDNTILKQFRNREVVCISIKVEHNVGSSIYDVCTKEYWEKAIQYIVSKIQNPLFFICSDNVAYVKENLIDTSKYDTLEQPKGVPVHISLALMSQANHFIIGNTTYGWWAQYLCTNSKKIVIAPSKWMKVNMPIDIYETGWKIVEV